MEKELSKTEEYIVDESQEISLGEVPFWTQKFFKVFPAFASRNYKLYFGGQLISLIGTWIQTVAQGWLVFEITHSPFWVGIIYALNSVPVMLFVLFGGVIVDRFSKKKILIFTQIASAILALIMGALTLSDIITVFQIAVLTFLLGIITALDMPARQALMNEIVDKGKLASAIAMNAATFNAARVIGPLCAGLLILAIGAGGAFIANALSFLPAIIATYYISENVHLPDIHPHPIKAIKEGLFYSYSHPIIRDLLIFAGINSIFGWSYITILPVISENVFHLGPDGLSLLYAAAGVGAVAGTVVVSAFSHRFKPAHFILGGILLFAISMFFFSLTNNIYVALPLLAFSGFGLVAHFSMMNTTIQHTVPHQMMGRVLAIYTFMFLGISPIGSLQVGTVSEYASSQIAIRVNAIFVLIFALYYLLKNKNLKEMKHV